MLGPALSDTPRTPDLMAEAGLIYHTDWLHDDQPVPIRVISGKLVSVPYSIELNDAPAFRTHYEGDYFARICKAQFDQLYKEGASSGRVMCIALHPFLIGQPHRIQYLNKILRYIMLHQTGCGKPPPTRLRHITSPITTTRCWPTLPNASNKARGAAPASRTYAPWMRHAHYDWSPISTRARLQWPEQARVALCVLISLDHMEWEPPQGSFQSASLAGGLGPRGYPDYPRLTHRDYGHRVGIFRVFEVLGKIWHPADGGHGRAHRRALPGAGAPLPEARLRNHRARHIGQSDDHQPHDRAGRA